MSDTTPQNPDDAAVEARPDDATDVALEPVMQPLSDDNDDDLASLLAKRQHARPNRATWVLLVLMVLAVGFVGGAFAQKTWGPTSATTGLPDFAALGGGFPGTAGTGTTGGTGAPGGTGTSGGTGTTGGTGAAGGQQPGGFPGGGFGGMTIGTLTAVDGNTLTITGQDGTTTSVSVPDSADVTASKKVPLSDLTVGETVIVSGEAGDDGTVTARSVSQGGGGFPGGGQGAPGQTSSNQQQSGQSPPSGAPAPSSQPTTAPTQGDAS